MESATAPIRFRLTTVFYVVALLASAIAAFGPLGIVPAAIILGVWACIFQSPRPRATATWIYTAIALVALVLCAIESIMPIAWLVCGLIIGLAVVTHTRGSTTVLLVLAIVMTVTMFVLVWTATADAYVPSRPACQLNMREICRALYAYEEVHGNLPPAYVMDKTGKPIHSWRVLILPHLEQQVLYRRYSFKEPWDGPNNSKLLQEAPGVYRCPGRSNPHSGMTPYVLITGPGSAWPSGQAVDSRDITDERDDTIMLVETPFPVPWTEPADLTADAFLALFSRQTSHPMFPHPLGTPLTHQGSTLNVVTFGLNCIPIADWYGHETVRPMLTIGAGDVIDTSALGQAAPPPRPKWETIIPLSVFTVLSLLPAWRLRYLEPDGPIHSP